MSFWETKRVLRDKKIQYSTIGQAILRIVYQGKVSLFDNPADALYFSNHVVVKAEDTRGAE